MRWNRRNRCLLMCTMETHRSFLGQAPWCSLIINVRPVARPDISPKCPCTFLMIWTSLYWVSSLTSCQPCLIWNRCVQNSNVLYCVKWLQMNIAHVAKILLNSPLELDNLFISISKGSAIIWRRRIFECVYSRWSPK
jgi:hypothetical protein